MNAVIVPFTKSPHVAGRVGKHALQDWVRQVDATVLLYMEHMAIFRDGLEDKPKIVLISKTQVKNQPSEIALYRGALAAKNVDSTDIIEVPVGYETSCQAKALIDFLHEQDGRFRLFIVTTWMHKRRVKNALGGRLLNLFNVESVTFIKVFGIPRPSEFVTDAILEMGGMWLINNLGCKNWLIDKVSARRAKGEW
jgi:hypothetical protein